VSESRREREEGATGGQRKRMYVCEWQREQVKLEDAEQRVCQGHWHMDEEFDVLGFDVAGHFNLEQVGGVRDEELCLIAAGPGGDGFKDVFHGL